MSHFTVAVFSNGESFRRLLEPYNENIEVRPYVCRTKEDIILDAKRKKERILEEKRQDAWALPYLNAKTDEEFYRCEYCEGALYDEDGNELSTYNPDSKWDWYAVGGRWSNFLKLKNGQRADQALVKDIDFSKDEDIYERALRDWDEILESTHIRKEQKEAFVEAYKTKEDYANRQSEFSTFAVITPDGEWHEQGRMGWFACVSEEDEDWVCNYKARFIDKADPNWTLTIVDCHI